MPLFKFTDTQPRVYVDRALEVQPGDEVDWDTAPNDGKWIPVTDLDKTRPTKPAKAASTEE